MIITPEMLANVAAQSEPQPKSSQSAPGGRSNPTSPQSIAAHSPPPVGSLSPPLPPPLDLTSISPSSVFAPDGTLLPASAISNTSQPQSSPGTSPPQSRPQSQVRLSSSEQPQHQQPFSKGHSRSRSGAGTSSLSQAVKDALSASYGFQSNGNGGGGGGRRSRTRSAQTDFSVESPEATPPNLSPIGATIPLPSTSAVIPPFSTSPSEFGVESGALGLMEGHQVTQRSAGSLSRSSGSSIRRALTSNALTPNWSRHQQHQQNDQGLSTTKSSSSFKPFMNSRANSSRDSLGSRNSIGSSALAALRNSPVQMNDLESCLGSNSNSSSKLLKSGFVSSLRRARSGSVTSLQEGISTSSSFIQPSNSSSSTLIGAESNGGGGASFSKRRWPKFRSGSSSSVNSESSESIPPVPSIGQIDTRRPSFGRRLLSNRFSMISSGVGNNSHSSPSIFNSTSTTSIPINSNDQVSSSLPSSSIVSSRRTSELDSVVESEILVVGEVAVDHQETEEDEEVKFFDAEAAEEEEVAAEGSLESGFEILGEVEDKDKTIKSRPKITKRPSTSDGFV